MSQPVELAALSERIARHGPNAFLVTVTEESTPHVVSVVVGVAGDHLVMGAGRRTRANLEVRPTITLLWSPRTEDAGQDIEGTYSLIVDGRHDAASSDDDTIAVIPTSAILHRVAGTPGGGPTCVPVS